MLKWLAAHWAALAHGLLLAGLGFTIYLATAAWDLVGLILPGTAPDLGRLYLASALVVFSGALLGGFDLFVLLPLKRSRVEVPFSPVAPQEVTVVLTAFNDEESIGPAVDDFRSHPLVRRVIVVDNASSDATAEVAGRHGATVVVEDRRGYGRCVHRALEEGAACEDTRLTLLCEGDMTFRSFDIDKFLAYLPHADIVNGTRIVEQLRRLDTQLTTFMYYGNFAVAKLLEAKHIGKGTFTDVGTTYKLCTNLALHRLLPHLNPEVNLEFNAHFLDVALRRDLQLVECPITFHARVGKSKGGNSSNLRSLVVGLRMVRGILLGWGGAR